MFSSRKRRRGAALVEFAFVGIMFCALLFGMLQFGIYLNATNALWNLSREGARYAAVKQATAAGDTAASTAMNNDIIAHVKAASPAFLDPNKMTITVIPSDSSQRTKQTTVTVQVVYDMTGKILFRTAGGAPTAITPGARPDQLATNNNILKSTYTTRSSMMVER